MFDKRFLAALVAACLFIGLAQPAAAQSAAPDANQVLSELSEETEQIEVALELGRLSAPRIEGYRATLEARRQQLAAIVKTIADQIAPLQAELSALGAAPDDGTTEAPEIAAKRTDLSTRIGVLDATRKRAQSSLTHVESLADRLVEFRREQFTQKLLAREPSPVGPAQIDAAWKSLKSRSTTVRREIEARIGSIGTETLIDRLALPFFLTLLAFGLAIWLRRRIVDWIRVRVDDEASATRRAMLTGGVTLVRLILPTVGIAMTLIGLRQSELLGPVGMALTVNLGIASTILIAAYAFGSAYFSPMSRALRISDMDDSQASRAYRWYMILAGIAAIDQFVVAPGRDLRLAVEALSVMNAILLVIGGYALWRFVRAFAKSQQGTDRPEDIEPSNFRTMGKIIRFLAHAIAIFAPLLALAGYYVASRFLFFPAIYSAAVIGIALMFQRWVVAVSTSERVGTDADDQEPSDGDTPLSALPVIIGFTLLVLAIPVLAVIWGAKATDLTSAWTVVVEGFQVGEIKISPIDFIVFAIVFAVGFFITRIVQGVLRRSVFPVLRMDSGAKAALLAGLGYAGITISALVAISTTALDLSNLAIVFGALSVGIGFGLQNVVNNFVSGIILLIERPIKVGDWVEVGGTHGMVRRINVRSTQIQKFDRSTMFVPNADLISGTVTNMYHGQGEGQLVLPIGVAYGSDVRQVEKILLEAAAGHPMVLRSPAPFVIFKDFGASSLDFELRGVMADVNMIISLPSELRFSIYQRFTEEGIEIPFVQRDITIRNIGDLRAPSQGDADGTSRD